MNSVLYARHTTASDSEAVLEASLSAANPTAAASAAARKLHAHTGVFGAHLCQLGPLIAVLAAIIKQERCLTLGGMSFNRSATLIPVVYACHRQRFDLQWVLCRMSRYRNRSWLERAEPLGDRFGLGNFDDRLSGRRI